LPRVATRKTARTLTRATPPTSTAPAVALSARANGHSARGRDEGAQLDGSKYRPPRVPPVEAVGLEERATSLAKRSIKKGAKIEGLKLAIAMMDLTTLEGKDTPGKVLALCRKAVRPSETIETPSCAAVCVYPNLVPIAKRALAGSTVKVASVATAFPSGQSPLPVKLDDVRRAVGFGADEIDMVIDRGAFLRGDYTKVFDEIAKTKDACGAAHLKVILETGELGTYDAVRLASQIAIEAGADFIKTSTGKVQPAATLPVTLLMLEAIRDHQDCTGKMVGMKPAGGVRNAKMALQYLCIVQETVGDAWMDPDWFRFGASALLNDVLMQLEMQATGRYAGEDYFSKD
jgi:deoxyribose-phosphate aldolase